MVVYSPTESLGIMIRVWLIPVIPVWQKNTYGTWYMQKGKLDTTFSGKITFGGKTYTIKNGKVI